MTIDWNLAKPGAMAVHRNSGRTVITRFDDFSDKYGYYEVWFGNADYHYLMNGREKPTSIVESPFDIISIEPAPEPVRVVLYGSIKYDMWKDAQRANNDTHRIVFDTIDGKPVCDSVRMEKL